MKISIAIMGHPKRDQQIQDLLTQIVWMRFCATTVALDTENSEWHTGKRALQAGIGVGDWHVVIQDDAIMTTNFYENLEGAIKALDQKTLISLYTGTSRPLPGRVKAAIDAAPDGSWLRHHQLFWGVGIVIPSDHIRLMLDFVENIDLQYDNKIGEFYCRQGLPVYYTVPSLVDHNDELDTLLPGHGRHISDEPRKAHRLAGGLIEWTDKERFI